MDDREHAPGEGHVDPERDREKLDALTWPDLIAQQHEPERQHDARQQVADRVHEASDSDDQAELCGTHRGGHGHESGGSGV